MNNINSHNKMSPEQREELIGALKARFEKNLSRHKDLDWAKIQVMSYFKEDQAKKENTTHTKIYSPKSH